MFHRLVSRNDDIRRLLEKGYALSFDPNNYLVIRDVPYLDKDRNLHIGAIVSKFVDQGGDLICQDDHQVYFAGSSPFGLDGQPIPNLGDRQTTLSLSEASRDVVVHRAFSNKPTLTQRFENFFDKIESYVTIISGPAIVLHGATPLTFRVVDTVAPTLPFKVRDTLTARAEIGDLAAKFTDDVVAVIGLGGTGSYILDYLVRTPVREIRGFDLDRYYVHNAFRSPGRLDLEELGKYKSEVYLERYGSFREGLSLSTRELDASSLDELEGVTFAFVCVDKGSSRSGIFDLLMSMRIPFIDVGMGLHREVDARLSGMIRATYYDPDRADELRGLGLAELSDYPDDEYRTNIQVGELNALNACLAVIKYKQLRGFYADDGCSFHNLFVLEDLKVHHHVETNED